MKKTSKMGRPKSDKPLKDNLATIRMTGDVMKKIKEAYGSVQKFFDIVSKTIPVFALMVLVSCNGSSGLPAGDTAAAKGIVVGATTTGQLYAIPEWIFKYQALGYNVSYSCSATTCSVTGEMIHYKNGTDTVTVYQIATATLTINGEYYSGRVCNVNMDCYNMKLRLVRSSLIVIDDGVNCTQWAQTANLNQYDSFVAGIAPAKLQRDEKIYFSGSPHLVIGGCHM